MIDISSLARSSLLRGSTLVFSARGVGAGGMLLTQILIARQLGVVDAGRIATGLTIMGVLSILGRYGADRLVLRRIAQHSDPAAVHRDYVAALRVCLPMLLGVATILLAAAGMLATDVIGDPDSAVPLRWFAIALPFFGLVAVQGEALKGAGAPGLGAATQSVVGPLVTLALFAMGAASSLHGACVALSAGFIASSISAHVAWRTVAGHPGPGPARLDLRHFRLESGPFLGTSVLSLFLTYAPLLSLALLSDPGDVGRFFAADRWTKIPTMMLVAVNATMGPRFATLWAQGRSGVITDLLRRSTQASSLVAMVIGGVLVLGAPWLLRLFGPGYAAAVPALRILAAAQVVVLACGPVTSLLVMMGGEREQRTATAVAATLVLVLCTTLVPSYGLTGAAIAAAVSLVARKAVIVAMARRALASTAHRPTASELR